jgi:hypothetical protein
MVRVGPLRRSALPLASLVVVAGSGLLLARGVAKVSDSGAHVVMVGPYAPLKVAYFGVLVAAMAVGLSLAGRRPSALGLGTFIAGLALAAAAVAGIAGYADAVALRDWTLMRLPPTEDVQSRPATIVAFARVVLVFLGALAGALVLTVASVRARGRPVHLVRLSLALAGAARRILLAAGRWCERWPRAGGAGLMLLILGLNTTGFRFPGGDQAAFSVAGRMILEGRLPYRDIWDIKFPAIHYVSAAWQALERTAMAWGAPMGLAAGIAATLIGGLTVVAFYRVSVVVVGRRWALPLAVVFAIIANDPILTSGGHLTESYVLLPALLAALAALRHLTGQGTAVNAVAVGFWSATAAMVRPQGAATIVAFVGALGLHAVRQRDRQAFAKAAAGTALAGLGLLLPWAVLLAYFTTVGILPDFLELPIGFNRFMASEFPASSRAAAAVAVASYLGALLPAVVVAAIIAGWAAFRPRRAGTTPGRSGLTFLTLLASVEMLAVLTTGRVAFHYMLQTVPVLLLLTAAGLARLPAPRVAPPRWAVVSVGGALAFQIAAGYGLFLARPWAIVADYDAVITLTTFIRARTSPDDHIFVGESNKREVIYYYADRPPASRYLYLENSMAAYSAGRYLEEIRRDLARSRPRLLVVEADHRWSTTSGQSEGPLNRYIRTTYAPVAVLEAARVRWMIFGPRSREGT